MLLASVLVATLALDGCGTTPAKPQPVVNAYLAAWRQQNWSAMAALVQAPPADFTSLQTAARSDLGVSSATYTPGLLVQKGSTATVPLTTRLTLKSKIPLTLTSTLNLQMVKGRWLVDWSPRTVSSQLGAGDHFATVTGAWPARAPVLGANGADLIPDATSVVVGLAGLRIKNPSQLQSKLVAAGLNAADVAAGLKLAQAHPNDFEPIQTISEADYQSIKNQIYFLPGTQFQDVKQPTPLTPALGAQIVGQLGPITAQQLKQLGPPYAVGDTVGQGGIEAAYERQLAGSPGTSIVVAGPTGKTVATLASRAAVAGKLVETSIDPTVQQAAEGALASVTKQAAIVVLNAGTGQVLASVSTPTSGFNLAFDGAVPPGSTFKVITSTALLESGVATTTTTTCPPTVDIDGKSFHNDEGETQPSLTFLQAFAESCNTAFIGLSKSLADSALPQAAATYGIGTTPKLGLAAYGGSVPTPASPVDLAATAIGQGQVTVSPLDMATVAAAVDSGSLHEPRLVVGAPDDTVPAKPLNPTVVADLHTLMNAVVTNPVGTAAGAGLPAGTFGKTGTAEFGSGPKPPTHAWFIGFDGNVAFAVFVYGGGTGGVVAAPIAAKMLDALGSAA